MKPYQYFNSLLEVLDYFKKEGDYVAFNLKEGAIEHPVTKELHSLATVIFLDSIKFEDNSDPDSVSLLHVVKTTDGVKGFIIDAEGAYAAMNLERDQSI